MRPRRIIPGITLAVIALVVASAAPAASIDPKEAAGTVVAKVSYRDSYGDRQPLAGVEVWLYDNGVSRYACTNAKGKAKFTDVTTDVGLISATGIAVSEPCTNPEFRNPDNGRKMLNVAWNGHNGTGAANQFQVAAGETKVLKYRPKTPDKEWKVCGGYLTTMKGTNGPDVLNGTTERDVINALGGDDVVHGSDGNDVICGGDGKDKLYGEDGNDWLFGEGGKDRLFGDTGDGDYLDGGPKGDTCKTGETYVSCETTP